ncbi:MAG: GNAT family N-acetyltransferase [Deltaproteobacteria bacterium]|nr:GNAT family N-acetyltransferase [Deltaproteobacteria bacterium]
MGSHGRYGKYGEAKRFARLRKAGPGQPHTTGKDFETSGHSERHKSKTFFRNQIEIIPARVTDSNYIRSLSKQVFGRYGPYDDTLTQWLLSGITITVLASMGRRPVGFAMLGRFPHDRPLSRVYELLAIAVEPEMQNLGIGGLLMREIERKAGEVEAETLVLHTAADNVPGRKLFKKHGFTESEIKNRFYPEGQDALMMHRDFL